MQNFTEVRCLALDFKDQNYGCEIEMTGLTREQAARAVAALFGTTARRTRESVTYDPWEVLDNDGKKWRFVYDGSIHLQRPFSISLQHTAISVLKIVSSA